MNSKEHSPTRSVLVTGCSDGGIGAALARSFASRPDLQVYATARSISKMSDLSTVPRVTLLALDVTAPESIETAVATLQKATGGTLDILVNNAGCGYTMPYLDTDVDVAKALFEVNVWGPMRVTQAVQHMLVQAQGTVVTIGSTAESLGLAYQSKFGPYRSLLRCQDSVADCVGENFRRVLRFKGCQSHHV
jgi:1-acylglycerone phosphate reductase